MASVAQAQTQAFCTFTTFSAFRQTSTGSWELFPSGINDYATVVGVAEDSNSQAQAQGFTRWSNGGISFYKAKPSGAAVDTFFSDRNNKGVTIGVAGTLLASSVPFSLQGSTFTSLALTIGTKTYTANFSPARINNWGTIVGFYFDSAGIAHGFKRWSNGQAIALNFPGAKETFAEGINDHGTIIGWYSATLPPNEQRHGFIYHNGQWATLDYPSNTIQTSLTGIDNANMIIGETDAGGFFQFSFIYANGTFKKVAPLPNGQNPPLLTGISLVKGLITGWVGGISLSNLTGFIGTCK
jgi:hypothetical protein